MKMKVGSYGDRQCKVTRGYSESGGSVMQQDPSYDKCMQSFSNQREATADKEPATPLETKISAAVRREEDVVIPRLIITHGLVEVFLYVLGRC